MSSPTFADYRELNFRIGKGHLEPVLQHMRVKNITAADYNANRRYARSPVYVAAKHGHAGIMKELLSMGFDHTTMQREPFALGILPPHCGYYPIHMACVHGNVEVVKVLVEDYGADVDTPVDIDPTDMPMHGFVPELVDPVSQDIDRHAHVDLPTDVDFDGSITPLWLAIYQDHVKIVRFFIEHGASRALPNPYHTPLLLASWLGLSDICEYLISAGEDLYARTKYRCQTAFNLAILSGRFNTMRLFMDAGMKINKRYSGPTALLTATSMGRLDIIKFLSSQASDPHIENVNGMAMLHHAVLSNHTDIVRYLVVDLNIKQVARTPDQYCLVTDEPVVDYVLLAFRQRAFDIVVLLIKSGYVLTQRHYLELEEAFDVLDPTPEFRKTLSFVRHILSVPRSLEEITCLKIRDSLGRNITILESLPLPRKLCDLVKLNYI